MTPKRKQEAIEKLLKSEGWAVLKEHMEAAILEAAYRLVGSASMPIDEVHFRRGSIWAAKRFLEMPDQVSALLTGELLMEAARKAANEPKRDPD